MPRDHLVQEGVPGEIGWSHPPPPAAEGTVEGTDVRCAELEAELADAKEQIQMLEGGLKAVNAQSDRRHSVVDALEDAGEALEEELADAREEIYMLQQGMKLQGARKKSVDMEIKSLDNQVERLCKSACNSSRHVLLPWQSWRRPLPDAHICCIATVRIIDTDADGLLELAEFKLACLLSISDEKLLEETFATMDTDSNGGISLAEFQAGFSQLQETMERSRHDEILLRQETAVLEAAGEQLEDALKAKKVMEDRLREETEGTT